MAMNKRGQTIIVLMMVGIMAFIMAAVFTQPIVEEIAKATNTTYLNASNPNISAVHRATVIVLDMGIFYFIGACIGAGIAFITGKKSFSGVITAIMVFVIVIALITPLKSLIILARDADHLNCASTGITVGARMTCILVDLWLFYFIMICLGTAITYVTVTRVIPKFTGES